MKSYSQDESAQIEFSYVVSTKIVYIYKAELVTLIEGDPKVPLSIATTPRYRGGSYSFPWFAPLYP